MCFKMIYGADLVLGIFFCFVFCVDKIMRKGFIERILTIVILSIVALLSSRFHASMT